MLAAGVAVAGQDAPVTRHATAPNELQPIVSESSASAPFGHAAGAILSLQRGAGNSAVAALLARRAVPPRPPALPAPPTQRAPAVQRTPNPLPVQRDPVIDKAIASSDPMDVAAITDYSAASEIDRMKFVDVMVGARSGAIVAGGHIIKIWRSFTDEQFQEVMMRHPDQWASSVALLGDPFTIMSPQLVTTRTGEFMSAVKTLADKNLTQNVDYVDNRMQQLGLKPGAAKPMSAEDLTKLRRAMQGIAYEVWFKRQSQHKLERTPIGQRLRSAIYLPILPLTLLGKENEPVYFDPKEPPTDPGMLEIWKEMKPDWDDAQRGISEAAGDYPEIYQLVAAADDDGLLNFSRVIPENFGEQQKVLLQTLSDRIKKVQDSVNGGEIDLLAFQPMIDRLGAGSGTWATGFNGYFAKAVSSQHQKEPSMAKRIAELGTIATVMLAPFATTGIGSVLEAVAVAVTVTAAAVDYKQAAAQAEAARATPVAGTDLVDRAVADEAKAKAESALIEAGVLAVITAITLGVAGGVRLIDAIRLARLKTLITEPAMLDKLLGVVSDRALLYRLANKSGDVTKLEGLLGKYTNPAELETLLTKAGGAARLEKLGQRIVDQARLTKLLDSAGSGERLAGMLERLGGVDEVEAALTAQAKGEAAGLMDAEGMKRVAGTMDKMRGRWDSLTPEQRLAEAAAEVNAELEVQGVPKMRVVPMEVASDNGGFRAHNWTTEVNPDLLADTANGGDPGKLGRTLMHEGRHAEQSFLSARASEMDVDTMTLPSKDGGLNLDQNIAQQAKARPLPVESTQGKFGLDMAQANQKYMGTGKYRSIIDRRAKAMGLRDDAKLDLFLLKNDTMRKAGRFDVDPFSKEIAAAQHRLKEADAAFDIADQAYKGVPFEKDAFAVEAEFERHLAAAEVK